MRAEYPGTASNRMYYMSGPNYRWRSSLMDCVQMKGETVIDLARVRAVDRKKMIRATQKGYARASNTFWVMLLALIAEKGRVNVPIGYLGKNNASLWVPTDKIDDVVEEMVALVELTGDFNSDCIQKAGEYQPNTDWQRVRIQINHDDSDSMRAIKSRRDGKQLANHFKTIAPQLDTILEESLSERQPLIDYLQSTEIVTIRHDSHCQDPDRAFIQLLHTV
jgi:hypothetical protein